MSRKKKASFRNALVLAMYKRYGSTTSKHADKRKKRQKNKDWTKEEW